VARLLRDRGAAAVALAGYLLLTLALTWPLATHFTRAIPGDGFDGWQNYWNLWWVKVALLEQRTSPFFTHLLYHPTGVGLLFHTLNPFNGLLALPIQLAFGLFAAYNAVVLVSFAVGGLGAYLLARQILGPGRSRFAAFTAGAIFTFAPVHIAHLLGHMQVISLEWIPLFVLFLLRAVEGGEQGAGGRGQKLTWRRNVGLATCFLILVALCDWYYVLYCLIFTTAVGAWLFCAALRQRRAGAGLLRDLVALVAVWLIWGVALSPLLLPMVREARQFRFMVPDPAQSRALSADLLAFVTPQGFHPLWGAWAREQSKVFTSSVSEFTVFAGFTVLVLAALGAWRFVRRRPSSVVVRHLSVASSARFWLLALLVFFILALGPVLHIGGRTALLPGGSEIVLPYGWLARTIPFMEITRSVSRYDIMVMLALAVLAAWGVDWLARGGRAGRLAAAAACAAILFEFLPAPYPMSLPDTPAWYRTLAADARDGAVLNLPMNWDRPGYLLYQTVHGKPLTAAYISREDPRTLVERAPALQHFRRLGPDIIAFDLAGQGQQALDELGVRWVVLDRYKMPGGNERAITEATARQIFGDQLPVYNDARLTVYEVSPPARRVPYLILGDGWGPLDAATHTRAFTGRAAVIVQAPGAGAATLRVTLSAGSPPLAAPRAGDAFAVPVTLQPGANPVTLRSESAGQSVIVKELALMP